MNQYFRFIGVNHHNSPLLLREKLAFNEVSAKNLLRKLKEVYGIQEALILSTCNRTELYFGHDALDASDMISILCVEKGLNSTEIAPYFVFEKGDKAVEQLFRVSLGLDSKVLGDIQIINQVKKAYQWTADEDMAGPYVHRLMHTVFFANKRVVQETSFRDGAGSVASVAVSLIGGVSGMLNDPRVLLVGTGEIGQNVLENLQDDYTDITVINRTRSRAEELDLANNFRIADYENLVSEVNKADVIITAIQADGQLIQRGDLAPSLTPRLLIDLSVPRVVSPDVEGIAGVIHYDLDQIEEKTSAVLDRRKLAIKDVQLIIDEHLKDFAQWSEEMVVSPTIQLLKEKLEDIRKQEIARHLKKLTPKETELINSVTKSMIQKVIKLPVLELKAACKRGEAETLLEAIQDIFNLEQDVTSKS